jgi:hypothetical protein
MSDAARVLEEGLSLAPAERTRVAIELLESLEPPPSENAGELWAEEIRRRVAEIDTGSVELDAWDTVRLRLHAPFAK